MFAVEWLDDREQHGEARIVLLGMAEGTLLARTGTEPGLRRAGNPVAR
jgi:hypothetical protein